MKSNDLDLLRQADPAAAIPDGPLNEDELAGLNRALARIAVKESVAAPATAVAVRRSRPRVTRRTVMIGVAATLVAAAGLVVVDPFGSTGVAIAATPVLLDGELRTGGPAKAQLLVLAAVAAKDTSLPGDAGSTHSVRTSTWDLSTRVDGETVRSAVLPEQIDLVWSSDQPGRRTVRTGEPYFPSESYRQAWVRAGKPGKAGEVVSDDTIAAGSRESWFTYPLPTAPAPLLAAFKVAHPIDVDGTGALVTAVRDLAKDTVPVPAVRAAVLQLLAGRSDVVWLGALKDRASRPVEAFAVDTSYTGLPQRQVLMFDAVTGALLASEDLLTKTAGALGVAVPSVISYTLFFPTGR
ncbi:hypothetical protein F1D05_10190 [Kribbella qitaiheensis]|uniref:CU044_5270 family protein n=1 Tax=Kribbella qitaiheensis TaxID=1544730 RepID=A0A7G6WW31_9ACTN|nr:hypothetical protein [Kribbella qitaiheensis]QNE18196.1 hypothetical protein F1D05_10190 [Kribbella qitaiheensis]